MKVALSRNLVDTDYPTCDPLYTAELFRTSDELYGDVFTLFEAIVQLSEREAALRERYKQLITLFDLFALLVGYNDRENFNDRDQSKIVRRMHAIERMLQLINEELQTRGPETCEHRFL